MGLYFSHLHAPGGSFRDTTGTELPDDESARSHVMLVARELLRNNEARARHWRVEICGPDHKAWLELVLADADETLDLLPPQLKDSVCRAANGLASLAKEISSLQLSIKSLKSTLRRAEGTLSLAAVNGKTV